MPQTPNFGFPYPAMEDQANVPYDISQLALKMDDLLTRIELAYVEITAPAVITAATEASAVEILKTPAIVLDGTDPILIEFGAVSVAPRSVNYEASLWLFANGSSLGRLAIYQDAKGQATRPARRLLPAAGSYVFSVRGSVTGSDMTVRAGPGGPSQDVPAFLRVRRV